MEHVFNQVIIILLATLGKFLLTINVLMLVIYVRLGIKKLGLVLVAMGDIFWIMELAIFE